MSNDNITTGSSTTVQADGISTTGRGRPLKWTTEALCDVAKRFSDWLQQDENNLFFVNFVPYIRKDLTKEFYKDVHVDFFSEYLLSKHANDIFIREYKRGREIQEVRYVQKALTNEHNALFTMFLLKCKHQWIEQDKLLLINSNAALSSAPINIMISLPDRKALDESKTPTPYTIIQPEKLESKTPVKSEDDEQDLELPF